MRRTLGRVFGFCMAMLTAFTAAAGDAPQPPNVAAAADLKFVLEEVGAKFTAETGQTVALTFGSSGNLYSQIKQGAPFELFFSADEALVQGLVDAGLARDGGALYAIGRIVLFAPAGSPIDVKHGLDGLRAALDAGQVKKFAIANPEHAPYGRAARQALDKAGLWAAVEPRLVLGENVAQAAQFVLSGSAEGGIVAYSLALAPAVGDRATWSLIPADAHAPLRQRMVLMKSAGPVATAFNDYLQTPAARDVLARYGFTLPEPAP